VLLRECIAMDQVNESSTADQPNDQSAERGAGPASPAAGAASGSAGTTGAELIAEPTGRIVEPEDEQDVIPLDMLGRGVWLTAKIVGPLFIGAIVLAAIFFDIRTALIAGFVAFVLMCFISIPLWLATAEDEIDPKVDEHPRMLAPRPLAPRTDR